MRRAVAAETTNDLVAGTLDLHPMLPTSAAGSIRSALPRIRTGHGEHSATLVFG